MSGAASTNKTNDNVQTIRDNLFRSLEALEQERQNVSNTLKGGGEADLKPFSEKYQQVTNNLSGYITAILPANADKTPEGEKLIKEYRKYTKPIAEDLLLIKELMDQLAEGNNPEQLAAFDGMAEERFGNITTNLAELQLKEVEHRFNKALEDLQTEAMKVVNGEKSEQKAGKKDFDTQYSKCESMLTQYVETAPKLLEGKSGHEKEVTKQIRSSVQPVTNALVKIKEDVHKTADASKEKSQNTANTNAKKVQRSPSKLKANFKEVKSCFKKFTNKLKSILNTGHKANKVERKETQRTNDKQNYTAQEAETKKEQVSDNKQKSSAQEAEVSGNTQKSNTQEKPQHEDSKIQVKDSKNHEKGGLLSEARNIVESMLDAVSKHSPESPKTTEHDKGDNKLGDQSTPKRNGSYAEAIKNGPKDGGQVR